MKLEELGFKEEFSDKYQTNWIHPDGCHAFVKRNYTGKIRWKYCAFKGLVQCGLSSTYESREEAYEMLCYVLDYKKNKIKDKEFFPNA